MLFCRKVSSRTQSDVKYHTPCDPAVSYDCSQWFVNVYTSDVEHAGTDANVYLMIEGSKGYTKWQHLDHRGRDDHEQGSNSYFVFTTKDIGVVDKIAVYHDNNGDNPAWHLKKIFLSRWNMNHWYHIFNVNRWVRGDKRYVEIGINGNVNFYNH